MFKCYSEGTSKEDIPLTNKCVVEMTKEANLILRSPVYILCQDTTLSILTDHTVNEKITKRKP